MFTIKYTKPEEANGAIKKVYSTFPAEVGVPAPLQLYSASPRYLMKQVDLIGEITKDEAYDFSLLAALRYIGASTACSEACTTFNKGLLQSTGLSVEEIEALATNPSKCFEEKEAALLELVAKSIAAPDSVSRDDIDVARAKGWTDQQIFELTAYAAQMVTVGIVFRTFSE